MLGIERLNVTLWASSRAFKREWRRLGSKSLVREVASGSQRQCPVVSVIQAKNGLLGPVTVSMGLLARTAARPGARGYPQRREANMSSDQRPRFRARPRLKPIWRGRPDMDTHVPNTMCTVHRSRTPQLEEAGTRSASGHLPRMAVSPSIQHSV